MSKIIDFILSPLGALSVFLLGILFNVVFHVEAEGIKRLYALIPSVLVLVIWITTSDARKSGK